MTLWLSVNQILTYFTRCFDPVYIFLWMHSNKKVVKMFFTSKSRRWVEGAHGDLTVSPTDGISSDSKPVLHPVRPDLRESCSRYVIKS